MAAAAPAGKHILPLPGSIGEMNLYRRYRSWPLQLSTCIQRTNQQRYLCMGKSEIRHVIRRSPDGTGKFCGRGVLRSFIKRTSQTVTTASNNMATPTGIVFKQTFTCCPGLFRNSVRHRCSTPQPNMGTVLTRRCRVAAMAADTRTPLSIMVGMTDRTLLGSPSPRCCHECAEPQHDYQSNAQCAPRNSSATIVSSNISSPPSNVQVEISHRSRGNQRAV